MIQLLEVGLSNFRQIRRGYFSFSGKYQNSPVIFFEKLYPDPVKYSKIDISVLTGNYNYSNKIGPKTTDEELDVRNLRMTSNRLGQKEKDEDEGTGSSRHAE